MKGTTNKKGFTMRKFLTVALCVMVAVTFSTTSFGNSTAYAGTDGSNPERISGNAKGNIFMPIDGLELSSDSDITNPTGRVGDRNNSEVGCMVELGDNVYIGINKNTLLMQLMEAELFDFDDLCLIGPSTYNELKNRLENDTNNEIVLPENISELGNAPIVRLSEDATLETVITPDLDGDKWVIGYNDAVTFKDNVYMTAAVLCSDTDAYIEHYLFVFNEASATDGEFEILAIGDLFDVTSMAASGTDAMYIGGYDVEGDIQLYLWNGETPTSVIDKEEAVFAEYENEIINEFNDVWNVIQFNGWIYFTIPTNDGCVVFRGREATDEEKLMNHYISEITGQTFEFNSAGWIWEEVVGNHSEYGSGFGNASNRSVTPYVYGDQLYFITHRSVSELLYYLQQLDTYTGNSDAIAFWLEEIEELLENEATIYCLNKDNEIVEKDIIPENGTTLYNYSAAVDENDGKLYVGTYDAYKFLKVAEDFMLETPMVASLNNIKEVFTDMKEQIAEIKAAAGSEAPSFMMSLILNYVEQQLYKLENLAEDKITPESLAFLWDVIPALGPLYAILGEVSSVLEPLSGNMKSYSDGLKYIKDYCSDTDVFTYLMVNAADYDDCIDFIGTGSATSLTESDFGQFVDDPIEYTFYEYGLGAIYSAWENEGGSSNYLNPYNILYYMVKAVVEDVLPNLPQITDTAAAVTYTAGYAMYNISGILQTAYETINNTTNGYFLNKSNIDIWESCNNLIAKLDNNDKPGFELYCVDLNNNDKCTKVVEDGFGDAKSISAYKLGDYNIGVSSILPTESGLFVGTANPFYGAQLWKIPDNGLKTVTFDANGHGTVPSPTDVPYDGYIIKPATPTEVKGYIFDGWYKDASCTDQWDFAEDVVKKDTTLYAKWDLHNYSITYNLNGGVVSGTNETSYNIESENITLINPTKDGYTFTGWTGTGLNSQTKEVTIVKGSTENRTYNANWQSNTGGTGGYVGGGGAIAPTTYKFTFDANGHGTAPAQQTVKSGDKAVEPKSPTAEGFVFGGWYADKECKTAFDFTKNITANTTVYAKWTEKKEEPKFDVQKAVDKLKLKATTAYTKRKNTQVTVSVVSGKAALAQITENGYAVKYKFYRSTKKSSGYKNMFTTKKTKYTNTKGELDEKYYYKAVLIVLDKNGKTVAKTELKDCSYGSRVFKGEVEE